MPAPQGVSERRKSRETLNRGADPAKNLSRIFGLAAANESSTFLSSGSNWTLKLKEVSEATSKALSVEVLSARLIHVYEQTDRDAAIFEIESKQGKIQAILSRSGEYSFFWKR